MNKKICLLLLLCNVIIFAFADKSRFYENGKVIDTLYIDSEDGLKVRDAPSLQSNRICGLTYRLPVKVVAIGKEETIDGVTAPWVEILLPCYEWKGDKQKYGWVFGGYLSKDFPEFKIPQTPKGLEAYLSSGLFMTLMNDNNKFGLYAYERDPYYLGVFLCPDNSYVIKKLPGDVNDDPHTLGKGTWYALSENSVVLTDDDTNKKMRITLDDIENERFTCHVDGVCFEFDKTAGSFMGFYSETFEYYVYVTYDSAEFPEIGKKAVSPTVNFFMIYEDTWQFDAYKEEFEDMLHSGVDMRYSSFEQQYHDYWNPIMIEHQKKADAMK